MLAQQMLHGCHSSEARRHMLLRDLTADDYLHILESEEHVAEDSAVFDAAHSSRQVGSSVSVVQHPQHQTQHQRQSKNEGGGGTGSQCHNSELICFSCGQKGHRIKADSCPAKDEECTFCHACGQ